MCAASGITERDAPVLTSASVEGSTGDDLISRLGYALDFASAAVVEFGEVGYADREQPALSFVPEKVVAEATMLAYAAFECTQMRASAEL